MIRRTSAVHQGEHQASKNCVHTYMHSGRRIVELLRVRNEAEYTEEDVEHMHKVVSENEC